MPMPEYLCPTTGRSCEFAQATGEVLGKQVLGLFRTAASNVAQYGSFSSLEMKIDPQTVRNLRQLEGLAASGPEKVMDAIVRSRNDVVRGMLSVFLDCGGDESGAGAGCGMAEDDEPKKAATQNALRNMTEDMMDYLSHRKDI